MSCVRACMRACIAAAAVRVQKRVPVGTGLVATESLFWRTVVGVVFAHGGFAKFHQLRLCISFKISTTQGSSFFQCLP